jgi:hypothetical protein
VVSYPAKVKNNVAKWFRRLSLLYKSVVATATVLALVAVVLGGKWLYDRTFPGPDPYCTNQGPTIFEHDAGACVGISDGSYVFDPALADVEKKIHEENQSVTKDHPHDYVSVVLLLPISADQGNIMSMGRSRRVVGSRHGPRDGKGRQGFAAFNATFQQAFPQAVLGDGNTMMAHDAVLTAVSAIRLTAQPQPAPYAVAGELSALHGAHTVLGASGPLAFTADYNQHRRQRSGRQGHPDAAARPPRGLRLRDARLARRRTDALLSRRIDGSLSYEGESDTADAPSAVGTVPGEAVQTTRTGRSGP